MSCTHPPPPGPRTPHQCARSQGEDGGAIVDKLFAIRLATKLKCEESGEEVNETSSAYTLKCNIANDTNYLHQVGGGRGPGASARR